MARRTILLSAGLVLLLLGGASAVGGGAVMALFGSDNRLTSGEHRISTSTNALVTSLDDVGELHGTADVVGSPTLGLQLTGTALPTFVGIAPAAAVDRYLATAEVETVRDLDVDPFRMRTVVRGGTASPPAPAEQSIWTHASAGGDSIVFNWPIRSGDYRLVVMNADGSPGVSADATFSVTVPKLFGIGVTILLGGLIVLSVGTALMLLASFSRRTPPGGRGDLRRSRNGAPGDAPAARVGAAASPVRVSSRPDAAAAPAGPGPAEGS